MTKKKKYLVIKHGALGDFIMATGPFAAIRHRHPKSHIILLTTKPYEELAKQSPYFDEVWVDPKAKWWEINIWWNLIQRLRTGEFRLVYDLQTSDRSDWYFRLMGRRKPLWSGRIDWCSYSHTNPDRTKMHTLERQAEQLYIAGITQTPKPDISWLKAKIKKFKLKKRFALIVAGGAKHRKEKRWTREGFAKLARFLRDQGIQPVFIGTKAEASFVESIVALCDEAINLVDQTSFADIAALARHAVVAVGNDTGPMHIIAVTDCASIVLFSEHSNPQKIGPRGKNTRYIQEEDLSDLSANDVISLLEEVVDLGVKS